MSKKELSSEQFEVLLGVLKARFEKNMNRHKDIEWTKVLAKLGSNVEKLCSLNEIIIALKLIIHLEDSVVN